MYPFENLLNIEKKNITASNDTTFFLCIFSKKFKKNITFLPYIEYLLFKQTIGEKNVASFPYIHFNQNLKTTYKEITELSKQLTDKHQIFRGFIKEKQHFYLFYEIIDDVIQKTYTLDDKCVWATIHEIVNLQKFCEIDIHFSTSEIFYKNPLLLNIYNEKKIELPITIYIDLKKNSILETLQNFDYSSKLYHIKESKLNKSKEILRCNVFLNNVTLDKKTIFYKEKKQMNILSFNIVQ